ncbi:MAG TPA: XRE family transcriptional regulator [Ferruginibacter sp.]|nr:XRE family transcriptional regulator [Ferruginibacter sp.]
MDNIELFAKNLKYLRKVKGVTQNEIAIGLGFKQTAWSGYELGKSTPNFSDLMRIIKYFNISASDLLEIDLSKIQNVNLIGKGSVKEKEQIVNLNVNPSVNLKGQNELKSAENLVQIPITDISVAAGTGQYNSSHVENVDIIRLPVHFLKRNHSYLCVRIKGPSMAPTLQDGGYVIIRLLDRAEWAKMPDERVFVISDLEGKAYLKRVKNRFKQGFIVLKSDSLDQANHPSFNLHASEINTIWEVEWYFTAKMPNIHDQYYSRLQQLEDRVDDLSSHLLKIEPKLK